MDVIFKAVIIFAAVAQVAAVKCYVCNYLSASSDSSTINSLLASSNIGTSDCWGTPSSGLTECGSSFSCGTSRAEMSLSITYFGSTFNYKYRIVTKSCLPSSSFSDTCSSSNVNDILSSAGLDTLYKSLGMTYTADGTAAGCICSTDGCNHGSVISYSPMILIFAAVLAIKAVY